jgi:hypothetical protein
VAPAAFHISHPLFLMMGAAVLFLLYKAYGRTERLVVKYGMATAAGAVIGVMVSYVFSHVILAVLGAGGRIAGEPGFTFWALFVALSFLLSILGGLLGLISARNKEENEPEE